jgi:hypothetical protein
MEVFKKVSRNKNKTKWPKGNLSLRPNPRACPTAGRLFGKLLRVRTMHQSGFEIQAPLILVLALHVKFMSKTPSFDATRYTGLAVATMAAVGAGYVLLRQPRESEEASKASKPSPRRHSTQRKLSISSSEDVGIATPATNGLATPYKQASTPQMQVLPFIHFGSRSCQPPRE